jgi:hypothetical protein
MYHNIRPNKKKTTKKDKTQSVRGKVQILRVRVGKKQTIETLISEEALLLVKYLRNEKKDWQPRIGIAE